MRITSVMVFGALVVMTIIHGGICVAEEGRFGAVCKRPVPDTWLQEKRRLAEQDAKAKGMTVWAEPIDCRPASCEVDLTEKMQVTCRDCSVRVFDCTSSTEHGETILTCRDVIWPGNPHSGVQLTEEEFTNTKTRCTKICGSCDMGWK
jgi:hypothetical protein